MVRSRPEEREQTVHAAKARSQDSVRGEGADHERHSGGGEKKGDQPLAAQGERRKEFIKPGQESMRKKKNLSMGR